MKPTQRKNPRWTTVRRIITSREEGCACVARHLYMCLGAGPTIWRDVLSGMTDDMEKEILDALNNEQPPGKDRSHARSL